MEVNDKVVMVSVVMHHHHAVRHVKYSTCTALYSNYEAVAKAASAAMHNSRLHVDMHNGVVSATA